MFGVLHRILGTFFEHIPGSVVGPGVQNKTSPLGPDQQNPWERFEVFPPGPGIFEKSPGPGIFESHLEKPRFSFWHSPKASSAPGQFLGG